MNNIMNHDKNPAMVVKDLCLWYSSTQALKDVNIEIEGQSITAEYRFHTGNHLHHPKRLYKIIIRT